MRSVNVLLLLMLSFHEMKSACKYIFIIGFQPRPQGFCLKKWVGATHFLREKPWGRGCGYHYFIKSKVGTVG